MPRKRETEKRLKFDGVKLTPDGVRKMEREKALKALQKAKALEAERLKNGYRYERENRYTQRLCKITK